MARASTGAAEVNTTDPRYYRWTQWIFTQLFKHGLAERRKAAVNWCPKDKTFWPTSSINGHCERCDSLIERRELEQWFLRITAYAEKLLRNLDTLDWSERVKTAQRAWIGRSEGVEFAFRLADDAGAPDREIRVYTTRPDTIYGVTFVVVAPEHPATLELTTGSGAEQVIAYRAGVQSRRVALDEEEGHDITGVFTGASLSTTNQRAPAGLGRRLRAGRVRDGRDHGDACARCARSGLRAGDGAPARVVVRPEDDEIVWAAQRRIQGAG